MLLLPPLWGIDLIVHHQLPKHLHPQLSTLIKKFHALTHYRITLKYCPTVDIQTLQRSPGHFFVTPLKALGAIRQYNTFEPLCHLLHRHTTLEPFPALWPPVANALSCKPNQFIALPLLLSQSVIYYNQTLLSQKGLDRFGFPKTWDTMQHWLERINRGCDCGGLTLLNPTHHLFESYCASHGHTFWKNRYQFAHFQPLIRHWKRLQHLRQKNLLQLYSNDSAAIDAFLTQKNIALIAPSHWDTLLRAKANFTITVKAVPFDTHACHTQRTPMLSGYLLWARRGCSLDAQVAMAHFIAFLLRNPNQRYWHETTHALPILATTIQRSLNHNFYRRSSTAHHSLNQASRPLSEGAKIPLHPNYMHHRTLITKALEEVLIEGQEVQERLEQLEQACNGS